MQLIKIKFLLAGIFLIIPYLLSAQGEIKREYYSNGKLKSDGTIVNGVRNGLYKEFYESGKLWKEWNYENGKEEGLSVWYFEDGKKSMEWNYRSESSKRNPNGIMRQASFGQNRFM